MRPRPALSTRALAAVAAFAVVAALPCPRARADEASEVLKPYAERVDKSVDRALAYLAKQQDKSGAFDGYRKVTVVTGKRERSIAGTVFSDGKPRFIQIKGINIDAEVGAHMLYTTNEDVPGIIGTLGTTMGDYGVNIANFTLGRTHAGGEAIALLYVDEPVPAEARAKLAETGLFTQIKPLEFDVA